MPSISADTRTFLWVIAAITGVVSAIIGNELAKNVIYLLSRRGRPPTNRPTLIWIIFFSTTILTISFGAIAANAPAKENLIEISLSPSQGAQIAEGNTPAPIKPPTATMNNPIDTATPSYTSSPTDTPTSTNTSTESPIPTSTSLLIQGCFDRNIWTPYKKDQAVSSDAGCWNLTSWGFTPQSNGMLIVPAYPSADGQFHGIYTPIKNNTEISFNIEVDMFVVEEGRTANIGIGIINLDPVGPATSRLVFYHYMPQKSKRYIPMQTGLDADYKDTIPTVLKISTPQQVTLKVYGPLLTMVFDNTTETQMTIPFENRAFWISYSVPPNSQLIMSIWNLNIK